MFFKYEVEDDIVTVHRAVTHTFSTIVRTHKKNYKVIIEINLLNDDYTNHIYKRPSISFKNNELDDKRLKYEKKLLNEEMIMFSVEKLKISIIDFTNGVNALIYEKKIPYKDRYFFTFGNKNIRNLISEDKELIKERRNKFFKDLIFNEVKKESREKTYISF